MRGAHYVALLIQLGVAAQATETLDHHRNRLLDTLAKRRGSSDRCALWGALTTVEKGIFLTHTDMLGNRSCFENDAVPPWQRPNDNCGESQPCSCAPGFEQALDHVVQLWALNGTDPNCCSGTNCCNGGIEWHRTYWSADERLIGFLRNYTIGLPEWGGSGDVFGPHAPFTMSSETAKGSPRGQIQLWRYDWEASVLSRNGVAGVFDPHVFEMDQDFNWIHDSNPEGFYSSTYGRAVYKRNWNWTRYPNTNRGDQLATTFTGNGQPGYISELLSDPSWSPTCGSYFINVGGVVNAWTYSADEIQVGSPVALFGSFADTGNRVLIWTQSGGWDATPGNPALLYESSSQINVQLPAELGPGEAFVYVEIDGVLTRSEWILIRQ